MSASSEFFSRHRWLHVPFVVCCVPLLITATILEGVLCGIDSMLGNFKLLPETVRDLMPARKPKRKKWF